MGFNDEPSSPLGSTDVLERVQEDTSTDTPWQTLLWNDPVNLVDYVTAVLMQVLECDQAKAEHHMMVAHTEGKAAVFSGTRDKAELIAEKLMAKTLFASIEKSGS